MAWFRIFLTWLLLAALPLQGWAAASMLYCATTPRDANVVQAVHHAAHTPVDGPADHVHHAAGDSTVEVDGTFADRETSTGKLPSPDHKCVVCAACGHGVALLPTFDLVAATPPPSMAVCPPVALLRSIALPFPDKPPRA